MIALPYPAFLTHYERANSCSERPVNPSLPQLVAKSLASLAFLIHFPGIWLSPSVTCGRCCGAETPSASLPASDSAGSCLWLASSCHPSERPCNNNNNNRDLIKGEKGAVNGVSKHNKFRSAPLLQENWPFAGDTVLYFIHSCSAFAVRFKLKGKRPSAAVCT